MLKSGMRSRGEMKMLHLLVLTLLTLTGVLSDGGWGVNYSEPICAVRGSDVIISCTYFYPKSVQQLERVFWCSMNSNSGTCYDGLYVYDSDSTAASGDFKYVGDKTSNCTLLISNVQFSHSGEYKFRFITDVEIGRWTGDPGVTLKVAVVQVSMIRLSGNGTLKEGDSVNLTCAVNCTLSSPQFVWFKNRERLPESGSVLHLPALTMRNSGNYSCALRNYENFTSEMISLDVKGLFLSSMVSLGLIVVILTLTAVLYCMWSVGTDQQKEDTYTTIIYSTVTTE
ncbi:sialoadhesin-like [Pygocentrus nattereri]|uniref:sialoadhesin-like n=1 Tax=Pygocentrus nattereri TaxID=42514 RepID=UPI0018910BC3|nr:sialoadhesin-like [Pygocentrus nattereri]